MTTLYGMRVRVSDTAMTAKHVIQKLPIRKRRKGYRVVLERKPAAFKVGNILIVHPTIYAKIREAAQTWNPLSI